MVDYGMVEKWKISNGWGMGQMDKEEWKKRLKETGRNKEWNGLDQME